MNEDAVIFGVLLAISATTNVALLVGWFRSARRLARLEKQAPGEGTERRVAQLEETIDAIGAQLDQLASGQEFLNRMIANERGRAPSRMPELPREITPH